jgi:hypothetical protein
LHFLNFVKQAIINLIIGICRISIQLCAAALNTSSGILVMEQSHWLAPHVNHMNNPRAVLRNATPVLTSGSFP